GDGVGTRARRRRPVRLPGSGLGALPLPPPAPLRRDHRGRRPAHAPRNPRDSPDQVPAPADDLIAMTPALELDGVKKSFGGVIAVNGVSLRLEPGRIYGLIGPNGSGKTTLFNCITGIERRDAGRILFQGERIDGLRPWQIAVRGVGRTFQVTRVFPELSALENLLVVTRGDRAAAERR